MGRVLLQSSEVGDKDSYDTFFNDLGSPPVNMSTGRIVDPFGFWLRCGARRCHSGGRQSLHRRSSTACSNSPHSMSRAWYAIGPHDYSSLYGRRTQQAADPFTKASTTLTSFLP